MISNPTGSKSAGERKRYHRPKAQLFSVLSILWLFPSLGALLILILGFRVWRQAESLRALLATTHFEQWVALLVLLLHLIFHGLARYYRKNETPQPIPTENEAPPDSG